MRAFIFTPGDLICRKGEVAREMFIIADGILEVIRYVATYEYKYVSAHSIRITAVTGDPRLVRNKFTDYRLPNESSEIRFSRVDTSIGPTTPSLLLAHTLATVQSIFN